MTTETEKGKSEALERIIEAEGVTETTMARIEALMSAGGLFVPKDYSPQNAVRGAYLILQETLNKDKKPVLSGVCTKVSVMYALLDMVVQGLNATKKQCYFIAYGNKLVCQRSYFGNMALAKRADPKIDKINAQVVYEQDEFVIKVENGETIVRHTPSLATSKDRKIKAVYCIMVDKDGKQRYSDVLSYFQITIAWKKSKMNPVNDKGELKAGSTHAEHLEEMAKKTVINHACKMIVNSSADAHLVDAMQNNDQTVSQVSAEEKATLEENGDIIDIESEEPAEKDIDPDTREEVPPNVGRKPDF